MTEPATFNQLLASCTTVWLKADPEDHMNRVARQGDTRPMAASSEAMEDLERILAGRTAFYSKADVTLDTPLSRIIDDPEAHAAVFAAIERVDPEIATTLRASLRWVDAQTLATSTIDTPSTVFDALTTALSLLNAQRRG